MVQSDEMIIEKPGEMVESAALQTNPGKTIKILEE